MKFAASAALVAALFAAPAMAGQANANGGLVRRGTASHKVAARASSSKSADDAAWTTINGTKYPTDLSADAPAPVITDNWWLDEVQKNDTTIHKFSYSKLPDTSEEGQKGTNICTKGNTTNSMCQTILLNAVDDFCLWGPPEPNTNVSVSEEYEVAWCVKDHGARLIPDGTLTSVHFVKTDAYVQITGTGDFTKINIAAGDMGGELDPHGATGNGNPIGGLVYTTAWSDEGKHEQVHEWMNEISATDFCFRGCKGSNATSQMLCSHIYDEMGCGFIMPANYTEGIFESCDGEVALAPGIISTWTFTQGDPVTPSPRSAASSSNCKMYSTIGGDDASTSSSAAPAASSLSTKKSTSSSSGSSSSDADSADASTGSGSGSGSGTGSSSSSSSNGQTLQQKSAVTGSSSASTSGAMPVLQGASFITVVATSGVALLIAATIAL